MHTLTLVYGPRIPESEETLRCDKLVYFGMEPKLDRPVLTSDCGSDVSPGAKKNSLWDWNRCVCHCLDIAVQSALKRPCIQKFVEPLVGLARKFSRSRSLWMDFKKVQLEMLHWEVECSNDEAMLILMEKRGFHVMFKASHK